MAKMGKVNNSASYLKKALSKALKVILGGLEAGNNKLWSTHGKRGRSTERTIIFMTRRILYDIKVLRKAPLN